MTTRTGIEELRHAVAMYDACREDWNTQHTAEELLAIARACQASEWDIYPDQWSERQVREAISGKVPDWQFHSRTERIAPKYDSNPKPAASKRNVGGYTGCTQRRRCRATGHVVAIYWAADQDIEVEPGEGPWMVSCEQHGCFVTVDSLSQAKTTATYPDWCEDCQAEMEEKKTP